MRRAAFALFVFVLMLIPVAAMAAVIGTATLDNRYQLPGVVVKLVPQGCSCKPCPTACECCVTVEAITDANGGYVFEHVKPGNYEMLADLSGVKVQMRKVVVEDQQKPVLENFNLMFDPEERFSMTSKEPLIDIQGLIFEPASNKGMGSYVVMVRKNCRCRIECPEDPKCGCCVPALTRVKDGFFQTKLPEGLYDIFIPGNAAAAQKDVIVKSGGALKIPWSKPKAP